MKWMTAPFALLLTLSALLTSQLATAQDTPVQVNNVKTSAATIDKGPDSDGVYTLVDEMPEFPGGQQALFKYLSEKTVYPPEANAESVSGVVFISFVIQTDGSIHDVRVVRSLEPTIDTEAKRVVETMPRWTPGRLNGQTVPVRFNLPFRFEPRKKSKSKKSTTSEVGVK